MPPRWRGRVLASPWRSARETAELLGVGAQVHPALADLDPGRWDGRSFADIAAEEPERLAQWIANPLDGTPGGETMAAGMARIVPLVDALAGAGTPACWITHPMMIRSALCHMLGFPPSSTLTIDLAPLSRVVLSFNGKSRLQSLGAN